MREKIMSVVTALLIVMCGWGASQYIAACSLSDMVPVLSATDAIGRGAAKVLGWCESKDADSTLLEKARKAIEKGDMVGALPILNEIVMTLREQGTPIPEEIEVLLRLTEGAVK